jgi:hypothetical protein
MQKILVMIWMMMLPLVLFGQKVREVSGTYTYYGDSNQSIKEVRQAAIENARVQALAEAFGTLLTQNTIQQESMKDGQERNDFIMLNAAEVKGEWLEDLKEPEILREELVNGMLVIEARVKGRARPISNEAVDFEVLTLRNGTEKRFADTSFKEGDDMFLYFKGPVDGFVAVYLVDEQQQAFCLLPYSGDSDGQQPVEHGKEYVFFSPKHLYDVPRSAIDEMSMTCADERFEHNQLYVLYSPNPFTKAVDQEGSQISADLLLPRTLAFRDFSKWMSQLCGRDRKMGRRVIRLRIAK